MNADEHGGTDLHQSWEILRQFALALPGAWQDAPWDEQVVKVNKAIFAFLGLPQELDRRLTLGVKLPKSFDYALSLPFARDMGYTLGQYKWVSSRFSRGDTLPLDLLQEWIEESYRAIATKRLVAQLNARSAT